MTKAEYQKQFEEIKILKEKLEAVEKGKYIEREKITKKDNIK